MQQDSYETKQSYPNKPDLDILKDNLTAALSNHSVQVGKITKWLDILNITGDEVFPAPMGKSGIQPKECRKQAEWRYAELSETFLATPDIFKVSPRSFLDRDAARQNQLILNYQFNEQMNKVKFVDTYIRNAVNEGTVIAKVCWKREVEERTRVVPNYLSRFPKNEMEANIINKGLAEYQQDPASIQRYSPTIVESIIQSSELGEPVFVDLIGETEETYDHIIYNQPDVEICDYRNVIIDPTCAGNLEDAQFIIYSYDTNLSSLRKQGIYENLDEVADSVSDNRISFEHTNLGDDSFQFKDDPRKMFTVYEYWGYYDLEGTGKTCPFVAVWVNDIMIRCERSPYPFANLPFVVIPYLPVKDSLYGEPDSELTKDNQRVIGALMRAMIDTVASNASGQKGIPKGGLDYLNLQRYRNGEDFEYNPNIPPNAIWQAQMPELPASSQNLLILQNNEAAAMTGIQPFSSGINGDNYGSTAAGVNTAYNAQAKRAFGIIRRLTEGLKDIAKMILAMNGVWLEDTEVIRITDDNFVKINRENLQGSFDICLSVSTQEMDAAKAQKLAFLLQTTGNSMPFEMTKLIYEDLAELERMPALAEKIRNYQPQPDPAQQIELEKLKLEVAKAQLELEKMKAETSLTTEKARKEASQTDLNTLEYIHKEQGIDHERDMQKQSAQAKANTQRDAVQAALKSSFDTKPEKANK